LGAKVTAIYNEPNGLNINEDCGSTHPENLQKAVLEHEADIGIAFDGDADRVILVDKFGNLIDGDHICIFWRRKPSRNPKVLWGQ
jgi:phosphoglucosamine mutase